MIRFVTACIVIAHNHGLKKSHGLYSRGLCSYGLYSRGLCSYGLYSHGPRSYGLCRRDRRLR